MKSFRTGCLDAEEPGVPDRGRRPAREGALHRGLKPDGLFSDGWPSGVRFHCSAISRSNECPAGHSGVSDGQPPATRVPGNMEHARLMVAEQDVQQELSRPALRSLGTGVVRWDLQTVGNRVDHEIAECFQGQNGQRGNGFTRAVANRKMIFSAILSPQELDGAPRGSVEEAGDMDTEGQGEQQESRRREDH